MVCVSIFISLSHWQSHIKAFSEFLRCYFQTLIVYLLLVCDYYCRSCNFWHNFRDENYINWRYFLFENVFCFWFIVVENECKENSVKLKAYFYYYLYFKNNKSKTLFSRRWLTGLASNILFMCIMVLAHILCVGDVNGSKSYFRRKILLNFGLKQIWFFLLFLFQIDCRLLLLLS